MKISLAEIVSDFSGFHRSPDFKPSRSMSTCRCPTLTTTQEFRKTSSFTPTMNDCRRQTSVERKHSTIIAIGVDEVPIVPVTSTDSKYIKKSRNSLPSISHIASSTALKEKLNKIKRSNSSCSENDSEEEFHCGQRKASVSSYRLI